MWFVVLGVAFAAGCSPWRCLVSPWFACCLDCLQDVVSWDVRLVCWLVVPCMRGVGK